MDFQQWLNYGIKNQYCTTSYCETHDGSPVTSKELELWDEGEDPCLHAVRLIAHDEELKELASKN